MRESTSISCSLRCDLRDCCSQSLSPPPPLPFPLLSLTGDASRTRWLATRRECRAKKAISAASRATAGSLSLLLLLVCWNHQAHPSSPPPPQHLLSLSPHRFVDPHGSVTAEEELVCDDEWKAGFVGSMFFLGIMIGAFLWGWVSDRCVLPVWLSTACKIPTSIPPP